MYFLKTLNLFDFSKLCNPNEPESVNTFNINRIYLWFSAFELAGINLHWVELVQLIWKYLNMSVEMLHLWPCSGYETNAHNLLTQ